MKKSFIFLNLIFFLLFPISLYGKNLYFSLGPTISLENFELKGEDETIEKEESLGFNLKIGRRLDEYIFLELDYDYIDSFEGYFQILQDNKIYNIWANMQIMTIIPMIKVMVGEGNYKNTFSTGFGYMDAKYGLNNSDLCWKIGIGMEYFFTNRLSIGINFNYTVGFGEIKFIEYYNLAPGISFMI